MVENNMSLHRLESQFQRRALVKIYHILLCPVNDGKLSPRNIRITVLYKTTSRRPWTLCQTCWWCQALRWGSHVCAFSFGYAPAIFTEVLNSIHWKVFFNLRDNVYVSPISKFSCIHMHYLRHKSWAEASAVIFPAASTFHQEFTPISHPYLKWNTAKYTDNDSKRF